MKPFPGVISQSEAFAILQDHKDYGKGRVFHVTFTKKDGTTREMVCRFGVKSYLKGGEWANGQAGLPEEHWLAIVFDMGKKGYRSIPVNRLHEIRVGGQAHEVSQDSLAA
jgi:hypothetical protein